MLPRRTPRTRLLRVLLLAPGIASCGTVGALGVAHNRNQSLQERQAQHLSHADAPPDKSDFRLAAPVVNASGIEVAVSARDTCPRTTDQRVTYLARNSDSFGFVESISPVSGAASAWAGAGVDLTIGAAILGTVWANSRLNRSMTPAQYATQRNTTLAVTGGVLAMDLAAIGFAATRTRQTQTRTIPERVACSAWRDGTIESSSAALVVSDRRAVEHTSSGPASTVQLDAAQLGKWWLLHSQPVLPATLSIRLQVQADDARFSAPFEWSAPQAQWPPPTPRHLELSQPLRIQDLNEAAPRWACSALRSPETRDAVVEARTPAPTTRWIAATQSVCPTESDALEQALCTRGERDLHALPLFSSPADMPPLASTMAPLIAQCDLADSVARHVDHSASKLQAAAIASTRCQAGKDLDFSTVKSTWANVRAVRSHYDASLPGDRARTQHAQDHAAMARALGARVKSRTCGTEDDWKAVSLLALQQAELSGSGATLSRVRSDTRPSADAAIRRALSSDYVSIAESITEAFTPWFGSAWAAARGRQIAAVERRLAAEAEREAAASRRAAARRSSRSSGGSTSKAASACTYCGGTWMPEGICWFDWNLSKFEKNLRRACYTKNK